VRGWGDQHQAVFETLDGYTVVEDPATKFYTFAALSDDGHDLIPMAARPETATPATLGLRANLRISRRSAKAKARFGSSLARGGSRWEERRRAQREAMHTFTLTGGVALAPPHRQTVGSFVGLCLLVQFPDVPGTITQAQVEAFCNQPGYNAFGNNGSVRDYFHDVSAGKLTYTNVVTPYYTALHPRHYYTDESISRRRDLPSAD
jgi:hypothetical protein